jgi:hypothetical protein
VSSRKEQKERLRQERLERERAAAASAARRRRFRIGGVALAALLAAGVAIVLVATSGGSSDKGAQRQGSVPEAAEIGLQTTPAPWKPESAHLAQRLAALKLPETSDTAYHIHAKLFLYVDGKPQIVPASIGIDPRFIAPVHTHDASGIVHMESARPYPFTLGQFFTLWGVVFGKGQLGAYRDGGGRSVQVYVNGKPVADPVDYGMKEHDVIVVAYGRPGSFPKKPRASFAGL